MGVFCDAEMCVGFCLFFWVYHKGFGDRFVLYHHCIIKLYHHGRAMSSLNARLLRCGVWRSKAEWRASRHGSNVKRFEMTCGQLLVCGSGFGEFCEVVSSRETARLLVEKSEGGMRREGMVAERGSRAPTGRRRQRSSHGYHLRERVDSRSCNKCISMFLMAFIPPGPLQSRITTSKPTTP